MLAPYYTLPANISMLPPMMTSSTAVCLCILTLVLFPIRLSQPSWKTPISVAAIAALLKWSTVSDSVAGTVIFYGLMALVLALSPLGTIALIAWRLASTGTFKAPFIETPNSMTVIYSPENKSATLDIVAVHGLGSKFETTWTHKISKKNWLKDLLPDDVSDARIMAFRHNSTWMANALHKDMEDHGFQLLQALRTSRKENEEKRRPLILIGHSFGGLLIKQALVNAHNPRHETYEQQFFELTESLAGVIFLGTPHQGSWFTWLALIVCHFTYWNGASTELLDFLKPYSPKRDQLNTKFNGQDPKLPCQDVFETVANTIIGLLVGPVVPKSSATTEGHQVAPADTNHSGMNKFFNREDSTYNLILDTIQMMVSKKVIDIGLSLEKEDNGIKIWHENNDATVDICFVHGLTGDRSSTWTATNELHPWPKTLLPEELDEAGVEARVLTYGYDVYTQKGSPSSNERLVDHARDLMNHLTTKRQFSNTLSRKLIFVAHSIGGLLCKEALRLSQVAPDQGLRNIFECIKGIIFIGTPHDGTWVSEWQDTQIKSSVPGTYPNQSLFSILGTSNNQLTTIQESFLRTIQTLREDKATNEKVGIMCYYEGNNFQSLDRPIVTQKSATFEQYNCQKLDGDHSSMVRFSSVEDNGFESIVGQLTQWEREVRDISSHLSEADRQFLCNLRVGIDPRDAKANIEMRAGGLLKGAYNWILENDAFRKWQEKDDSRFLWVKGDPGKGKTMLLCGIIDALTSTSPTTPVPFFFCQAAYYNFNNASAVLRGLVFMLLDTQRNLITDIRTKHEVEVENMSQDPHAFPTLEKILKDILRHPKLRPVSLIIDALDELDAPYKTMAPGEVMPLDNDYGESARLLKLVCETSSWPNLKWIVSSRNDLIVEQYSNPVTEASAIVSLELNQKSVSKAVTAFINQKVEDLAKYKDYDPDTRQVVEKYLCDNAEGTFLWVALVCKSLSNDFTGPERKMTMFPRGLDELYGQMLKRIAKSTDKELCNSVLKRVVTVYEPLALEELISLTASLKGLSERQVKNVIQLCGSFLTLKSKKIHFVHKSAKDFLTTEGAEFALDRTIDDHYTIFSESLDCMKVTLRRNIYGLSHGGILTSEIEIPKPDPLLGVRYSCIYWASHLSCWISSNNGSESHLKKEAATKTQEFIEGFCLYWLEALSLSKSLPHAAAEIRRMSHLAKENNLQYLDNILYNAHRYMISHRHIIEVAPLQVYVSALIFSPTSCLIRQAFELTEGPAWIIKKPQMRSNWDADLLTLETHQGDVRSIAFSLDNAMLASGSQQGTIKVWDTFTGECLQSWKSGPDAHWVRSLVFATNSKIISGGDDKSIKVWDLGIDDRPLKIFHDLPESIREVITTDNVSLISLSDDHTLRRWNLSSGELLKTIRLPGLGITISPDGCHVAVNIGFGKELQILKLNYDKETYQCVYVDNCYGPDVVFTSRDAGLVATNSRGGFAKIWDSETGSCQEAIDHSSTVYSLATSNDGTRVAFATWDEKVSIWDLATRSLLCTYQGPPERITFMSFSNDDKQLAAGSFGGFVKTWDLTIRSSSESFNDAKWCDILNISPNRLWMASIGEKEPLIIWDTRQSQPVHRIHGSRYNPEDWDAPHWPNIAFSPDGRHMALCYRSNITISEIGIWTERQIYSGPLEDPHPVAFSSDGAWLAFGANEEGVDVWDMSTMNSKYKLRGSKGSVTCLEFSSGSQNSLLAAGWFDREIYLWKMDNGTLLRSLKLSQLPLQLRFSPHGLWLASLTRGTEVEIWDINGGELVKTLNSSCRKFAWRPTRNTLIMPSLDSPSTEWEITKQEGQGGFSCNGREFIPEVHLSSDLEWILLRGQRSLWLPPEYRLTNLFNDRSEVVTSQSSIGFISRSGRALFLEFSL